MEHKFMIQSLIVFMRHLKANTFSFAMDRSDCLSAPLAMQSRLHWVYAIYFY